MFVIKEEDYLAHIGTPRHSGRYEWGSGDPENQRNKDFLGHVADLHKQGIPDKDIAKGMGMTLVQLRAKKTAAKNEQKAADITMAQNLKEKGLSNTEIGKRMAVDGVPRNESSIRLLLNPSQQEKVDILNTITDLLQKNVDEKGFIDIGSGVENHLKVSKEKLAVASFLLQEKGYREHVVQIDQQGTANKTLTKVLCPPGTEYRDVAANKDQIRHIFEYSDDGGRSTLGILPPLSIDSKRVAVRYLEDGGGKADGMLYVRPGVKDVSLGSAKYAQVRVTIDGTHYLKGMAVYKDDLPKGVDIEFNTKKSDTGNKLDAMKGIKTKDKEGLMLDVDDPYGSYVRQIKVKNEDGTHTVTSSMNMINSEGNWDLWSRNLSAQTLSKQSPSLAKTQLDMTYEKKKVQYDEIMALTNPTIRKKLLEAYASSADSSATHLKAAALPRSNWQVLLPMNSLKVTEIYAPNYNDGETVALIRYPHAGTFEIPELVVNNRNREAKKVLGQAIDAIAINHKVAERLSGADFDGDAVLVIPNNHRSIKTTPALAGLKNFDPQIAYKGYEGMPTMSIHSKGTHMGSISNLITDMTIGKATNAEVARAVRHSMVVIDAEKHGLNYKQSAIDNNIKELKQKYQTGGASTLISRAQSTTRVPKRTPRPAKLGGPIDPETGKKVFVPVEPSSYIDKKTGKEVKLYTKSVKLAETDDAYTLSSGTLIESVYADHSNRMKGMANSARKEALNVKFIEYSNSAWIAYRPEVDSLNSKLNTALMNRPLERQAQVFAAKTVSMKRQANPNMDSDDVKKVKFQALEEARTRTGARKQQIHITDDEWAAIQAGAIHKSKLKDIVNNADIDRIKELATPRKPAVMTTAKSARAAQMYKSGYTQSEIAAALGVSVSTLKADLGLVMTKEARE